jgi:hypothetical protein
VIQARDKMPLNPNYGRPKTITKYSSVHEYLENFLFPIKDSIPELKRIATNKQKEANSAHNKVKLQEDRLDRAYEGLEVFRQK